MASDSPEGLLAREDWTRKYFSHGRGGSSATSVHSRGDKGNNTLVGQSVAVTSKKAISPAHLLGFQRRATALHQISLSGSADRGKDSQLRTYRARQRLVSQLVSTSPGLSPKDVPAIDPGGHAQASLARSSSGETYPVPTGVLWITPKGHRAGKPWSGSKEQSQDAGLSGQPGKGCAFRQACHAQSEGSPTPARGLSHAGN